MVVQILSGLIPHIRITAGGESSLTDPGGWFGTDPVGLHSHKQIAVSGIGNVGKLPAVGAILQSGGTGDNDLTAGGQK